jgi:hypothetical protein|tara:strand:+ start:284 stop:454 length:171 start_codon:yes stop_codon:yes gene_type:complete
MVYLIEHYYYLDGSLRDSVEFKTIKETKQWVGEMLDYNILQETIDQVSLRITMKEK